MILSSFHSRPAKYRKKFNALLFVSKSVDGMGPKYIRGMVAELGRCLRSAGSGQLVVHRVQAKHGEMAFSH